MRTYYLLLIVLVLCSSVALAVDVVDINHANTTTLALHLKGVGQKKAKAIVEYRNRHGKFKKPEDLLRVKGIGLKTLSINRHRIRLGPAR